MGLQCWRYGHREFQRHVRAAPAGTYALTNMNILASPGQGGSGSVSIIGANSTTEYNPSQWNLLGSTQYVSGAAKTQADNSNYMTFRSYQTDSSAQTLYAHRETMNIRGTPYYLQRLAVARRTSDNSIRFHGHRWKSALGQFYLSFRRRLFHSRKRVGNDL